MIIFPGMLVEAAKQANMKCPEDPDSKEWSPDEYPHFNIYCLVQLCRSIRYGEHWENAKVVAAVPEDQIRTITLDDLIELGLEY